MIRRELTIWCDACGVWTRVCTASVRTARKRAAGEGWTTRRLEGHLVDLCPSCASVLP